MKEVTFITGNQSKADYLAKFLEHPVSHIKLDLDELQSLDLRKIVGHKAKQAYQMIKKPVLVEDVSMEFVALNGLPGPFIKFFVDNIPMERLCRMIDGMERMAIARSVFAFYDGDKVVFFEGKSEGTIAEEPAGDRGYGWDQIYIPNGYSVTRASLNEEDDRKTYLQLKPLEQLKDFFQSL